MPLLVFEVILPSIGFHAYTATPSPQWYWSIPGKRVWIGRTSITYCIRAHIRRGKEGKQGSYSEMEKVPTKLTGTSNCPASHVPNERNLLLVASEQGETTRPKQANSEPQRGRVRSAANKRKVHKVAREAKGRTHALVDSLQKENLSLLLHLA